MKAKTEKILTRSLLVQFFQHGKIKTTLTRAKFIKGKIEKVITIGKKVLMNQIKKDIALVYIRRIESKLKSNQYLKNVLDISKDFIDRSGGYLTIDKIGFFLDGSIKTVLRPVRN